MNNKEGRMRAGQERRYRLNYMQPLRSANRTGLLWAALLFVLLPAAALLGFLEGSNPGQVLYNGIHLPAIWPQRDQTPTREPMKVPYLVDPPKVIPIDIGRQLFVDDFLIEQTTLKRTFHAAEPFAGNPILKADQAWELGPEGPRALVFSDGVWYDPADRTFKMWYLCGDMDATCYATSNDGIHWEKPVLDVQPGTNIVLKGKRDSSTVWLDVQEKDSRRRFKLMYYDGGRNPAVAVLRFSADGIHWGEPVASSPPLDGVGDRTTIFWNPFREVWVFSIRDGIKEIGRCRRYWEDRDLMACIQYKPGKPVWWTGADKLDAPDPVVKLPSQLYNLDAVAYESLMLGLFSIWRGPENEDLKDRPKRNEVSLGFSRDGFHWDRPDRRPFVGVSERRGDWNWGNVQSAGGGCLIVGDILYFYFSGRRGNSDSTNVSSDAGSSTGLAFLRRDGFASMDAGETEGTLTTRLVTFRGKYLFVNAGSDRGELRVEVLDAHGEVVPPFSRTLCAPIRSNKTLQAVRWNGVKDLGKVAGLQVKFRFYLRNGHLYSFWVGPDPSGPSYGYVAAGGPGFADLKDTVGSAAYQH